MEEERKRHPLAEEEARAGKEMASTSYGITLAPVTSFNYLQKFLLAAENNCPVVVHNLWRAHHKWERLYMVLIREGVDAWNLKRIYVAAVQ